METQVVEKQKFDLIKGDFTPGECKEVLTNLFTSKINFHVIRDFSHRERFGTPDILSQERLKQLKRSNEEFAKIIESARETGATLRVRSSIELEIVNPNV